MGRTQRVSRRKMKSQFPDTSHGIPAHGIPTTTSTSSKSAAISALHAIHTPKSSAHSIFQFPPPGISSTRCATHDQQLTLCGLERCLPSAMTEWLNSWLMEGNREGKKRQDRWEAVGAGARGEERGAQVWWVGW